MGGAFLVAAGGGILTGELFTITALHEVSP